MRVPRDAGPVASELAMTEPIQAEAVGTVTIVTFRDGVLVAPDQVEAIREVLDRLIQAGHRNLLFDFGGVEYLGSHMLAVLLKLKRLVTSALPPWQKGRSKNFKMYPDRESALRDQAAAGPEHGWFALCNMSPDLRQVFILA
jgi:hypothetical protein